MKKDVEDSLRRMGTDYLDSVIVHYVCGSFPVEETVGALENLVREGKIRTYGLSNSQPADLAAYQEAGGNVSVVQEFFSILSPFHGREYFEMCRKNNTVFQTYGVLEEGFLTSPAFLDKEFPEAAMVSEWGEPEKSLRGGFHMDFLLHFGPSHYNDLFRCEEPYFSDRGVGDASAFVEKYLESRERAGKDGLICIPSGNHDMTRLAKHVKGDEKKLAFAFLLTMPGAPFIYYGDEIGMRYVEGLTSVEGGYERTGARSPMQWDNGCLLYTSPSPRDCS